MQQRTTENPESGATIGTEIDPETVSEPGSPQNQAEDRHVLTTWKYQKSHPLDQILTDLNSGVQTRSSLRIFMLSKLFSLLWNLRMSMKL